MKLQISLMLDETETNGAVSIHTNDDAVTTLDAKHGAQIIELDSTRWQYVELNVSGVKGSGSSTRIHHAK